MKKVSGAWLQALSGSKTHISKTSPESLMVTRLGFMAEELLVRRRVERGFSGKSERMIQICDSIYENCGMLNGFVGRMVSSFRAR